MADADSFAQLSEDEKRLIYHAQLGMYNRKLAQTAHNAGVITSDEHAEFQNAGYKGLYGGLTEDDIHVLKKLELGDEISNWMGSEELADNIFRAAQTDSAMKRNKVQGKEKANKTHFEVGNKVREFIIHDLGERHPKNYLHQRKVSDNLNKRNNSVSNTKINSTSLSLHQNKS
jgi:DNA-damage-inducible protein D